MRAHQLAIVLLAAGLAGLPTAIAHGGHGIELVAREGEDCPGGSELCLEIFSLPAELEPGQQTTLLLRNHAEGTSFTAALTTPEKADPNRKQTPRSAAIATTPTVPAGERGEANLTLPDTSEAYAWLVDGDHEERGGWEMVPLWADNQGNADGQQATPAPAAGGLVLAAVAGALAVADLRRR